MTIEILAIAIIIMLALPLLVKRSKFATIERRHELQRSMKKLQSKYPR